MSLQRYLDEHYGVPERQHPSVVGRVGRKVLPESLRLPAKLAATKALLPRERRKARRLEETESPLRLHLGCGNTNLPGWVNIDLAGVGAGPDLVLDLLQPLPFSDGVVDAIFHEHVMEHFRYRDALRLARECARVLKPGGVLRIGVPDFGSYARSYSGDQAFIENVRGGRPLPLLAMAEVVYDYGHASIWDAETIDMLFRDAGLQPCDIEQLGPAYDTPSRRPESVYREACK